MLYTLIILLLIPVYLEKFEVDDYGSFSVLYITGTLISIVFSVSISNGILRFFHEYDNLRDRKLAITTMSLFFIGLFILTLSILFVTPVMQGISLYNSESNKQNFIILTIWAFGRIFINMFLGVLRADNKPVKFVVLTVIDVVILCITNIIIIYTNKLTLTNLLNGYLFSTSLSVLISLIINKEFIGAKLNSNYLKYFMVYGIPLAFANCISYLINYGNRYFLLHFTSKIDVAVYDIAQKITGVIGVILVNGFLMAFTPYYLNLNKIETKEQFNIKINRVINTFLGVYFLFGILIIFSDNFILDFLSKKEYLESASYTPFLILSNVFNVLFMLLAMTTNILKKTKVELYATIVVLCVGLVSNFLLIKAYGLYGAVISQMTMSITGFIFINIYNAKFFPLDYKFKTTFILILNFLFFIIVDKYLLGIDINVILKILIYLLFTVLFVVVNRKYFVFAIKLIKNCFG
jgi:O-antigen/teichoic acid export membrane protein